MASFATRNTLSWIASGISLTLLVQIIISWPLWWESERIYPHLPLLPELAGLSLLDQPVLLLALFGLCLILWYPQSKKGYWFFLPAILVLLLADLNRLQVWMYESAFFLMLLAAPTKDTKNYLRMALIFLYCWSGLHKFNIYFIEDITPWFLEPFGLDVVAMENSCLGWMGASFELLLGLGLYWSKTRKWTAYLAVLFHLFILGSLGPLGHHWNEVVWPWNLLHIFLLYLLFIRTAEEKITFFASWQGKLGNWGILLLFGIAPILNFWQLWPEQLSFKMYAGTNPEGIFYYYEQDFPNLPPKVASQHLRLTENDRRRNLILDEWIFTELRVGPFASPRRLKQAGKALCQCLEKPEKGGFEILYVSPWNREKDLLISFSCLELRNEIEEED